MGSSNYCNIILVRMGGDRNNSRLAFFPRLLLSASLTFHCPPGAEPGSHQGGIAMFFLKETDDMILGETKFGQVLQ